MRLLRPHIPVETRVRVVLRQLGELWPDGWIASRRSVGQSYGNMLRNLLDRLAELLACTVKDLHLDHEPALAVREKVFRKGVHVDYIPPANSAEHLGYRPHAAQFANSHHVKTNIRGDHGQHPDRVLIKKNRRYENGKKLKPKPRFRSPVKKSKVKRKWASRPMKSANRWAKRSKK